MRRCYIAVAVLGWLVGCGDDVQGDSGDAFGAIVDNFLWQVTDAGTELFDEPPPGAECPPPSEDCPVPDGECVVVPPTCRATYIVECFDPFAVLAVYTDSCDWVTLEQPLLRDIRAGDTVEVRTFHFALNAPVGGQARVALAVGDEAIFDELFLIPQGSGSRNGLWVADRDIPAGTTVLFHVSNHGDNEYLLVEANVCDPDIVSDDSGGCLP